MKSLTLFLTGIFTFVLLFSLDVNAQQEAKSVSDDELKSFVSIQQEVQVINSSGQQEMIKVVQDEGLNVQKYNEIDRAMQQPNIEPDATESEIKKYENASQIIGEMYIELQEKVAEKVQEGGLTMKRFEEIQLAIQQNPELQQKFQQLQN